jgi:hypothetical protein
MHTTDNELSWSNTCLYFVAVASLRSRAYLSDLSQYAVQGLCFRGAGRVGCVLPVEDRLNHTGANKFWPDCFYVPRRIQCRMQPEHSHHSTASCQDAKIKVVNKQLYTSVTFATCPPPVVPFNGVSFTALSLLAEHPILLYLGFLRRTLTVFGY